MPDWETFYRRQPRSVVILPVENETTNVEAPRFFMATVARPLIDRGYYVFPVEATSEILASEGLTDGAELRNVTPERFHRYFGTEGVLFVTLKKWDTVYLFLQSSVIVTLEYTLLDTRSGEVAWSTTSTAQRQSGGVGSGNVIADLIAMAVDAALTAALTDYISLARQANSTAFQALVPGAYHAAYEPTRERLLSDWRVYQERKKAQEAARAGG